jgi:MoxR-like ATPases
VTESPSPTQARVLELRRVLAGSIIGQADFLDRLVVGLLAGGHVLVEGLPGLAKTTAVRALAAAVNAGFCRVQFTPDLLPGDLTGTEVFQPGDGSLRFVSGPLFHQLVLADEINRAPAKVQSALLEAMQERQITVGGVSRALPSPFMVLATQNPIEQAGTYPLPEAQLDRFLLHLRLDYPASADERRVLDRHLAGEDLRLPDAVIDAATVLAARAEVRAIHLAEPLRDYVIELVRATREPQKLDPELRDSVAAGASPRAALALADGARALAYLRGRDHVLPDDLLDLAPDVLRHRLLLTVEASFRGIGADHLIARLLERLPPP